jgi:1-deoxy-D-xylulose-5-phosphate reductoisomerase
MNKGLEVIEAARLFGLDAAQIKVLIHPQSIVHSLVEFVDHAILGQLSVPDMKLPIQYALTFPKRLPGMTNACDLTKVRRLDFLPPDHRRFPCLGLAYEALRAGGTMPAVLNSANETVVGLFLSGRLRFSKIPSILSRVMARHRTVRDPELEQIRSAEEWARITARESAC